MVHLYQLLLSLILGRLLSDGTIISKQGNCEFVNEISTISALQHPHLVKLYGCCIEGQEKYQLKLDWPTRHRICIGIARGLAYLHEESKQKIVHRDIKATNVLLEKILNQ